MVLQRLGVLTRRLVFGAYHSSSHFSYHGQTRQVCKLAQSGREEGQGGNACRGAILAVEEAMSTFLSARTSLHPSEVALVVSNAPSFIANLASLIRTGPELCPLEYLCRVGINELEPFLESLGVSASLARTLLPSYSTEIEKESALIITVRTFESVGIHRTELGSLLEKDNQLLRYTKDEITQGIRELETLGVHPDRIANVITNCPKILRPEVLHHAKDLLCQLDEFPLKHKILANAFLYATLNLADIAKHELPQILRYLYTFGLSKARVNLILRKTPQILVSTVNELKKNIHYLSELGISPDRMSKIVSKFPVVLINDLDRSIVPKIDYFHSLGLDNNRIAKMIPRYPVILGLSIEQKIKPRIEELSQSGVSLDGIRRIVVVKPSIFAYKPGGLIQELLQSIANANCPPGRKAEMFLQMAKHGIAHKTYFESYLTQRGLSNSEAKHLLEKKPRILASTKAELRYRIYHLVKHLELPIKSLLAAPQYLCGEFKPRILSRQLVLSHLKSKGLLSKDVSLAHMVNISTASFRHLYVSRYQDCTGVHRLFTDRNVKPIGKLANFFKKP